MLNTFKLNIFPITSTSWITRNISFTRERKWQVYENERYFHPGEEGWKRAAHWFTYGFRRAARRYREAKYDAFRRRYPLAHMKREVQDYELLPMRSEFLIIGGGLTGSSIAYWLKQGFRDEDLTVTVVESTQNFARTRSMLGTGIISQQFSIPEMVDLAMFSAEFLRHAGEHLKILDNDPPDIHFLPVGVLHLARTQEQAEIFRNSWKIQVERGARVTLLGTKELQARFPFMDFRDVVMGSFGLENEGIFDTWQFLAALREKNITLGVRYIKGEVEGPVLRPMLNKLNTQRNASMSPEEADKADMPFEPLCGALVRPQMSGASARPVNCFQLINAAGPWAGEVAKRAGIGQKGSLMRVPVPVVCIRRTNFIIHAPEVPVLQMPILMDPSGIFCRPDGIGHNYVCGRKPTIEDAVKMMGEKPEEDPPIDYNHFYEDIWPNLVKRIPSFKNAKVINSWHSYEDFNTFDEAPVIGEHLVHDHFFQMCGLGGYGPQLSIALGKMYSERAYDDAYSTVNLRKFDMRRIMHGNKFKEAYRCV